MLEIGSGEAPVPKRPVASNPDLRSLPVLEQKLEEVQPAVSPDKDQILTGGGQESTMSSLPDWVLRTQAIPEGGQPPSIPDDGIKTLAYPEGGQPPSIPDDGIKTLAYPEGGQPPSKPDDGIRTLAIPEGGQVFGWASEFFKDFLGERDDSDA